MIISILCEDSKVVAARESVKTIFKDALTVSLSKDGKLPATHWYCVLDASEEKVQELRTIGAPNGIIIEESKPKEFLTKNNLKLAK